MSDISLFYNFLKNSNVYVEFFTNANIGSNYKQKCFLKMLL